MATLNINNGDTLEHATIGDVIINYYGERQTIVGEQGSVWVVETNRKHGKDWVKVTKPVFKYDPSRVVVGY
jgi:hypothetical protein